jgi:uncharacterized protein
MIIIWPSEVAAIEVPQLQNRVNDYAGVLSSARQAELENKLKEFEAKTSNQLALLTLRSLEGEDLESFAVEVFDSWRLGQQGADNGVLLLVISDDRKLRIEVGYGLEPYLTDAASNRIIQETIIPYFRAGRMEEGIAEGLAAIEQQLQGSGAEFNSSSFATQETGSSRSYGLLIFLLIILAAITGWYLYRKHRRNAPRKSRKTGLAMQKLNEQQDDQHLSQGQKLEEVLGSVDYDVWVTSEPGDVLVIPYKSTFSKYKGCPKCNYRTYTRTSDRVLRQADYSRAGEGERIYTCKNCGHKKREVYFIPKLVRRNTVVVVGAGGFSGSRGFSGGGFSGGGGFRGGGGFSGGGGASGSW